MLLKEPKYKFCHWLKKQFLISGDHPETWQYFNSYPSMLAERQRQVYEGGKHVIHPLSIFCFRWNSLMVFINLAQMMLAPFRLTFLLDVWPAKIWTLDYVLLAHHIICLLDIIVKFNLGFHEKNKVNCALKRKKIALRYLCSWFLLDVCSSLPLPQILIYMECHRRYILLAHCLACLRSARIVTCFVDVKVFMKKLTTSYSWHVSIQHLMLLIVAAHWCSCIVYVFPVFYYYWYGQLHSTNNAELISLHGRLLDIPVSARYGFSLFFTACAIFGIRYYMFHTHTRHEVVVNAVIILIFSVFTVYITALMFKLYLTKHNAELRYIELMDQVERYMRQKLFPAQMKKRVRDFYNYRYHGRYFKEVTLNCLSEQLRSEINLYSCHRLVENVSLFEDIPASVVGAILGCLHAEVYMPNDVIVRAGDVVDCVYFINSGTVAIYTGKGTEVSHLDDGDLFGVVALIMKDLKQAATVVAIEITQLYRMDTKYFRQYVLTNKTMMDRIQTMVSQRMHVTVLIDKCTDKPR
ncbi:potassium/sodium hyperpolarization-activated cyclic nucleotide-gated channel 2-like [Hyposmocoma kahamanoa]|uniref:potassium/sodium hyperpolarization-activated cyclic nucleotide-gated channel 2-like n=1 Tax=Hyposmocoma kahamanoa TaxID=1477025 RepID=UPI000E6D7263|nr:potassium/sodium hyperpolarization-activated cyclic nucleotide-gated channel 2-like [Hyposmocoma kahamanoa]